MKHFFFTGLLLFSGSTLYTQVENVWQALTQHSRIVTQISPETSAEIHYFPMPYASAVFSDEALIRKTDFIKNAPVLKVSLVYTTFRRSPSFDQPGLNEERLTALEAVFPGILENPAIEWELLGQSGCASFAEGDRFFHGFVIYTGIPQNDESHRKELAYMDSIIQKLTTDTFKDTILYFTKSKWDKRIGFVPDSNYAVWGKGALQAFKLEGKDSLVMESLNKNRHLKDVLIVADVTGSMASYNAQLITWLSEIKEEGMVKSIVFFNDGDRKKEEEKKLGEAGGIYFADPNNFANVLLILRSAMNNGHGGALEENNIEAILRGIENCPDCKEVIMIADNNAPMRDASLMKKIRIPVSVILGNYNGKVLPQYKKLATSTGGKILNAP